MFLQVLVSGLTGGSVYALIALGFCMIYKATGVMNFAQGQLVTVSGYFAVMFHQYLAVPYALTFLLTMASTGLLGILLERGLCRPLITAPPSSVIIATVAIGMMIENAARIVWGPEFYSLRTPFSLATIDLGFALVTHQELWILAITLALFGALYLFFATSRWGTAMRAVSSNQVSASLMGISVKRVFSLTWGINSALGAAAGILLAPLVAVAPGMGTPVAITAFAAAILGGANSLPGAVVGGFTIGIIESVVGFYLSTAFRPLIAFIVLIGILMVRPSGLLGGHVVKRV